MLFILTHITKYLTLPAPNRMDRLHPLVCPSGFPRWCAPWTSVVDKSVVGVAQLHTLWGGESLLTRRNVQGRGLGSGRHTFIRLRRRRGALLLSRGRRPIRPVTPRRAPEACAGSSPTSRSLLEHHGISPISLLYLVHTYLVRHFSPSFGFFECVSTILISMNHVFFFYSAWRTSSFSGGGHCMGRANWYLLG